MLTKTQINEIREHLEQAQNPLFFFDNDNDGLISFLLLRRFIGRGKGISIRSFPDLNVSYYKRIEELNPDYIFILDKPLVSKEFLQKCAENNLPVVWIDHHAVEKVDLPDNVSYYNTYFNDKTNEPVSYLCYHITNKKEDLWLALIGCISDAFLPDFYKEFNEYYPELGKAKVSSAFDLLYTSEIGKIARILDFGLKDTTSNVVNLIKFMFSVKSPSDILEENSKTKPILKKFEDINKRYQVIIEKAHKLSKNKFIYFQYSGGLSLSSNVANQLIYEYPEKVIVVVYLNSDIANISIRGKIDVLKLTLKAIENIEGATGGGHKNATGAKLNIGDLPKFKKNIKELLKG